MLYYDSEFKLHTEFMEGETPVETDAFDGKCREYIEGHRYVPEGSVWVRDDGKAFPGVMCVPWKPKTELDAAQAQYERDQAELAAAYQEGVNSV